MTDTIDCARCTTMACIAPGRGTAPETCPARTFPDVLRSAANIYREPTVKDFACNALLQHNEAVLKLPEGGTVPRNPRIEEIAQFAAKMSYSRLGIAFCSALKKEAAVAAEIFSNRRFSVVSVCCSAGSLQPEALGVTGHRKLGGPDARQAACNPVAQAELLNAAGVDFNVMIGLCVGHDSLFFRYAKAPTTVLVVKDRVLGHNPIAALHESATFYRWLLRKLPTA